MSDRSAAKALHERSPHRSGEQTRALPRGAAPGGDRRAGARGVNRDSSRANPHTKRPEVPINAPARSGSHLRIRGQGGDASEEWGADRRGRALDRGRS